MGLLPMGQVIGFISVLYASLIALATALAWKFDGHSQTIWGSIGIAVVWCYRASISSYDLVLFRLEAPMAMVTYFESSIPRPWGRMEDENQLGMERSDPV